MPVCERAEFSFSKCLLCILIVQYTNMIDLSYSNHQESATKGAESSIALDAFPILIEATCDIEYGICTYQPFS